MWWLATEERPGFLHYSVRRIETVFQKRNRWYPQLNLKKTIIVIIFDLGILILRIEMATSWILLIPQKVCHYLKLRHWKYVCKSVFPS